MGMLLGFLLIIASIIGTLFFGKYHGTAIAYPWLWYLLFILAGFVGFLLIVFSIRSMEKMTTGFEKRHADGLKANAEKIELNFDCCEFKNGGYHHEVRDGNISSLNLVAPASASALHKPVKNERVVQSYLVYSHSRSGNIEKYISHAFPFDEVTLKYYVLSKNLVLYIDRFDKKEYLFDLNT